jgi:hypothetical protein
MVMQFERDGARVRLEVRRDGRDVPPLATGEPRVIGPEESMRDVVVVSESGYLWTADDEEEDEGDDD